MKKKIQRADTLKIGQGGPGDGGGGCGRGGEGRGEGGEGVGLSLSTDQTRSENLNNLKPKYCNTHKKI